MHSISSQESYGKNGVNSLVNRYQDLEPQLLGSEAVVVADIARQTPLLPAVAAGNAAALTGTTCCARGARPCSLT